MRGLNRSIAALLALLLILCIAVPEMADAAMLRQGSSGEQVKTLQSKLKRWGYYNGNVDGIFGSRTEDAVEYFQSKNGLVTTMAASADGTARYALEGSVFIGGAVIQWIRDELHLIHEAADSEYFATRLEDNGGVYVVPAFTGLGAPYWDMYARGAIMGLTRGCNRKHIIRAALESIAYQSRDVLVAMERDTDIRLQELRVDGGASANNFLMQFQSDIIHTTIRRPMIRETTALGAAYLAGLATGVWNDLDEIREQWTLDKLYTPQMSEEIRERNLRGWDKAIGRVQHWEDR